MSDVLSLLCVQDPRHPDYDELFWDESPKPTPQLDCSCDNCFYGRTKLANEIMRLQAAAVIDRKLLRKAGRMADSALALVGGMGLNNWVTHAHIDTFSEAAKHLRTATEEYNRAIIQYHPMEKADVSS
jgi:hypothetical protein